MVDFGRRNTPKHARSLPMSALHKRERTANAAIPCVRQRPTRAAVAVKNAAAEPHSPPNTPNPYQKRVVTRRALPLRANSHSIDRGDLSSQRSSNPSKYTTGNSNLTDCCLSGPAECFIPSSKQPSHHSNNPKRKGRSYGVVQSLLRAVALLFLGFGGGMIFNMYNSTSLSAHIDLESIPSVLLTDELVKKLAHDNQLQEQEIQQLHRQVAEARKIAEVREQDPAAAISFGGLRAVKRLRWDNQGKVQELDINQGESVAGLGNPNNKLAESTQPLKEDPLPSPSTKNGWPVEQPRNANNGGVNSNSNNNNFDHHHDTANSQHHVPAEEETNDGAPRPAPLGQYMAPPPKGKIVPLHMAHEVDNTNHDSAAESSRLVEKHEQDHGKTFLKVGSTDGDGADRGSTYQNQNAHEGLGNPEQEEEEWEDQENDEAEQEPAGNNREILEQNTKQQQGNWESNKNDDKEHDISHTNRGEQHPQPQRDNVHHKHPQHQIQHGKTFLNVE